MSAWKKQGISYTQIPAMQMFLQAENGTSTWEEAAYACWPAGLLADSTKKRNMPTAWREEIHP